MRDYESQVPNFESATGDYPSGQIRDTAGPTAGTGVVESLYGDVVQFFLKLMIDAGLTANTLPENVTNGYQLIDALVSKSREALTGGVLADLDTAPFNGFFEADLGTLNKPAGQAGSMIHTNVGTGGNAVQLFNSNGSNQLFTRRKIVGSWLPWVEYTNISESGNIVITPYTANHSLTTVTQHLGKYKKTGGVVHATAVLDIEATGSATYMEIQADIADVFSNIPTFSPYGSSRVPATFNVGFGSAVEKYEIEMLRFSANVYYIFRTDGVNWESGDGFRVLYQGSYVE